MQIVKMVLIPEISQLCSGGLIIPPKAAPTITPPSHTSQNALTFCTLHLKYVFLHTLTTPTTGTAYRLLYHTTTKHSTFSYDSNEKKSTPSSNKWLTLLFACLLLSCTVCNAATTETLKPDTITLSLTEAGTLHKRIGNNKKLKIECLRLKGMLNIDDIQFIREMAGCYYDTKGHKYDGHLRYLDISGATLTNTDNKEVSIYPRDPSEYEGTPWPSAEAYINDKGTPVAIFAYLYDMEEIVLPAKLKSIGDDAFIFCRSLKSINIPESVQKIGLRAFFGCSSLKSMKLPIGITEIKSGLLSGCTNLTSIDIPYTTEEIGHNAFSKCTSLKSIELPYSLNNMGISVFYGCTALTSVTIPKNIRYISDYTF